MTIYEDTINAAHPSAPVGVEKVKKALERLDLTIEACAKLTQLLGDGQPHSDLISTASGQAALAKEAIQRALAQQPVIHPAITHCDNCGCDWLDNGLNPIGCPYCKYPVSVDEAMVEGLKQMVRHLEGNPNFDFDAALAAQQQGGRADGFAANHQEVTRG